MTAIKSARQALPGDPLQTRQPTAPNTRPFRPTVARERAIERQHHRRALARWRTRCPRGRTATASPTAPTATPAPTTEDSPARGGGRHHHRRTTAPGTRRPDSPPPPPTSPHDQRHAEHQHQPHRRPIRTRTPGDVIRPAVRQRRHAVTTRSEPGTMTATAPPSHTDTAQVPCQPARRTYSATAET